MIHNFLDVKVNDWVVEAGVFPRSLLPFLYTEKCCLGSQRINLVIFD